MSEPVIVDTDTLARVEPPRLAGRFRVAPADFVVEELFDHPLEDAGEHFWLWVEKSGLTTGQAAERIAEAVGVAPRDVGYAGMKDRHAVTRQWFSLVWPIKAEAPAWPNDTDCRVLAARRHGRKLRRGAHRGNRFVLRLRDVMGLTDVDLDTLGARIRAQGVPNYFGAQRFGREGDNVEMARALFAGRRMSRSRRSIALSAARSYLFNQVLARRVAEGSWQTPLPGDVFMLAGTHSVFSSDTETADRLTERVASMDIHPTGPMPGRIGRGHIAPTGVAGDYEAGVLEAHAELVGGLAQVRVDADRRSLRLPVTDLELVRENDDTLVARFELPAGAFATSVLREIGAFVDAARR